MKLLIAAALLALFGAAPASAFTVAGNGNVWLSGMPAGTSHLGDSVPDQSPTQYSGPAFSAGDILTFSVTGGVSFSGGTPSTGPDGSASFTYHSGGAVFGISGARAPINGLVAVFLGDDQPDGTPAPADLDFVGGLDFTSLSPLLKQVFFIGDGMGTGGVQEFVVPVGATRLFMGGMDGFGWYNNTGSFEVSATNLSPPAVPLPAGLPLLLTAFGATALLRRRKA